MLVDIKLSVNLIDATMEQLDSLAEAMNEAAKRAEKVAKKVTRMRKALVGKDEPGPLELTMAAVITRAKADAELARHRRDVAKLALKTLKKYKYKYNTPEEESEGSEDDPPEGLAALLAQLTSQVKGRQGEAHGKR